MNTIIHKSITEFEKKYTDKSKNWIADELFNLIAYIIAKAPDVVIGLFEILIKLILDYFLSLLLLSKYKYI